MQFDYVTGVLFFWVVCTSTLICLSLWLLAEVLRRRDQKFNGAEFELVKSDMRKFDTRFKGIEKLWIDSQKKNK